MEKIDIRDLRVGDWLLVHHPTMPAESIQISADWIRTIEQINNGLIKEDSPLFRIVEPIPLTKEILEKTGFKFKKNGFGLYSYRLVDGNDKVYLNGTFTELEYTNVCRNYDDPDEVNYGSNMEFPKPLELHQLQNILRDLGIEKEIII